MPHRSRLTSRCRIVALVCSIGLWGAGIASAFPLASQGGIPLGLVVGRVQEDGGSQDETDQKEADQGGASGAETGASKAVDGAVFEPYAARVKNGGTGLHAGPDAKFPTLREAAAGDLVVVVQEVAGWSAVEVPQGYIAYIHGRYVKPVRHGLGEVTANGVNLRPRPSSGGDNLPIDTLEKGTPVFMLGENDGWIEVGAPPVSPLWVKTAELERAGTVEDHAARIKEIRAAAETVWLARIGPDPAEVARQQQVAALEARLTAARKRLEGARGEQATDAVSVAAIAKDLEEISGGLEAAGAAALAAEGRDLARQARDLETSRRPPVEVTPDAPPQGSSGEDRDSAETEASAGKPRANGPAPERPALAPTAGSRFTGVGWVELVPGDREASVHLKKGGITVYRLVCRSGRYRLADFKGKEVGVVGAVRSVAGAADLVDVERLEIVAR